MKTIIMAGGGGTRISTLFPDIPKPLISITNASGISKPVLQWEIESLSSQGFKEIILTVSYMHELIEDYFGDGSRFGVSIEYFVEEIPLGNAGALFKMRHLLTDNFLLINADTVFDVDFQRMAEYHRVKGALVTLFTHPNSHPYDSGIIVTNTDCAVTQWLTKEDRRTKWYKNRVNAGLHIVNPIILNTTMKSGALNPEMIGKPDENGKIGKVDLDRQLLKPLCGTNQMYAYDSSEYVKDMGTPERFYSVSHDFATGIVKNKNLKNKQKAIFLDRDGTINRYVGFLRDIDQFELIEDVAESIKCINESGYLCIVVTNQPVIARGEVTISQLQKIHNKLETLLGEKGAYIDKIYYCPHHPDKGFRGEIKALKINCNCRKPKHGMLLKAAEDFNIDLSNSWMVGDSENDVKTGINAGCKTALINIIGNSKVHADITVSNLKEAVNRILGK